jgi:diphosphate-dependent phosphofructokinase
MTTPLAVERAHETPILPEALQHLSQLGFEPAGDFKSAADLKSHFPLTQGQPLLKVAGGGQPLTPLHIGVVFSGGPAPGGHNVIWGLFDALPSGSQLFGFQNGPSGIVDNRTELLTRDRVDAVRNQGGFDLLGTGRTKIETPEQLEGALKTVQQLKLDGLVVVGGDDSNTNAAILAEFFRSKGCSTCVIGVPKTIDGDLKGGPLEISFGHDTACKIYADAIGNLKRDALSARKYTHFVKLMGRSASHIALECALQTHTGMTLIGEEVAARKQTLAQVAGQVADWIEKRSQAKKDYGVVVVPEGLIEFIPEVGSLIRQLNRGEELSGSSRACLELMPKEIQQQLQMDRDPHGNVQVSKIETERLLIALVEQELKRRNFAGKFSSQPHFMGYEARCGYPSRFDAAYCYALGRLAALLVARGFTGYMAILTGLTRQVSSWTPAALPLTGLMHLEERKGQQRPVIAKALVDLGGKPFTQFAANRDRWVLDDAPHQVGPIQYQGGSADAVLQTLQLELG